jgi:DNA-binding NtrC family response regulator
VDLQPLIDHFLAKFATDATPTVTPEARQWLLERPWRGNVRELENTIERAVLLSRGRPIERADLEGVGISARPLVASRLAGMTIAEMERRLILDTLRATNNNRTRAAQQLGISIRTLRNKLAEYRAAGSLPPEAAMPPEAAGRHAALSDPAGARL